MSDPVEEMMRKFGEFVECEYGSIPLCNSSENVSLGKEQLLAELSETLRRPSMSDEEFIESWNRDLLRYGVFRTATHIYASVLMAIIYGIGARESGFPKRLVDIGCGLGIVSHFLQSEGLVEEVVGLEPCSGYIDSGKIRIPVIKGNPGDTKLPTGCGDLVLNVDVISLCYGWRKVVREQCRLAAPDGIIVIVYFYGDRRVDVNPADVSLILAEEGVDVLEAHELDRKEGLDRNIIVGLKRKPRGITVVNFAANGSIPANLR